MTQVRPEANQAGFARQLLEAKIAEHLAYAGLGERAGVERCRNEAGAALEAYFDNIEALARAVG